MSDAAPARGRAPPARDSSRSAARLQGRQGRGSRAVPLSDHILELLVGLAKRVSHLLRTPASPR